MNNDSNSDVRMHSRLKNSELSHHTAVISAQFVHLI